MLFQKKYISLIFLSIGQASVKVKGRIRKKSGNGQRLPRAFRKYEALMCFFLEEQTKIKKSLWFLFSIES